MNDKPQRVCVIVNPVSGVNREAMDEMREFFAANPQLEAKFHETKADGDARRIAREAADSGFDLVAAYGGDGTQMEAADGLRESGGATPLFILPGGTANVMAVELGIPLTLGAALALMVDPARKIRQVDMGVLDNSHFLLRAGIGYEAEMSAQADRSEKSKSGRWAYFKNAWHKMRNLRQTRYIVTVDGEMHIHHGITCMICNSSNIGLPNLRLVSEGSVSDGLLDVIVIASMRPGSILRVLLSILLTVLPVKASPKLIAHWQGRKITVESQYRQLVARDGELLKRAKRVSAYIVPKAVRVVVPASSKESEDEGAVDNAPAAGRAAL